MSEIADDVWLMTKTVLRKLIDEDRWDELGRFFNFTPKFTLYQGKTYFDWSSAPAKMLDIAGWTGTPPTHRVHRFKYKLSHESGSKRKPADAGKKLINLLFESQGGKCFYCGHTTDYKQRSKDHKLPRSRGGRHESNYVGACKTCNQAKGNMTFEEFLETDYLDNDRRRELGFISPPRPYKKPFRNRHDLQARCCRNLQA